MDKPYVIGIDIGGTNSVFGVVDTRGNVLYNGSIKTGKYEDVNDYVRALGEGLQAVIRSAGGRDKIKGIGVGAPNGNYFNGCIEFAANLPWKGKVPLAQLISDRTGGIPVTLTNDANAAAIGEMTYGAARGLKDFIVITLGTGVGSGIVCGGNLVYGHDGFAGELGHTTVRRENGRLCGCGRWSRTRSRRRTSSTRPCRATNYRSRSSTSRVRSWVKRSPTLWPSPVRRLSSCSAGCPKRAT